MLLQSLYFSRFLPNRPRPLMETHARWQPVTQSARCRRSYGKIEDCEQSITSLGACFHVFFNVCLYSCSFPLRADWRKSDSSVDVYTTSGSHRASRGGIQIPETWLEALRPFSRAAARTPRRACSQASWGIKQILPPTVKKKTQTKVVLLNPKDVCGEAI